MQKLRNLALIFVGLMTACAQPPTPAESPVRPDPARLESLVHSALETAGQDSTPSLEAPVASALADAAQPRAPQCRIEDRSAPGLYRTDPTTPGQVVLTFDDGPHPTATKRVLDLLNRLELPATFFVVGRNIHRKSYSLIQRMFVEGHTLGTHTFNHDVHMAERAGGERVIEYIRGQHVTTHILIELALLAQSPDDFDALFTRVFDKKAGTYLEAGYMRQSHPEFQERHRALLSERGYGPDERPYPVLYSRPPGGGPYLGLSPTWQTKLYDSALERAGYLNVLWHGGAGDTVPEKRGDFAFLTHNLAVGARRGGVLLIHDYIRHDALTSALTKMKESPDVQVVPIAQAVEAKFGCSPDALSAALAPATAPESPGESKAVLVNARK